MQKLELFQLDETHYVNVDTTTNEGIQRASHLNLASSHLANVIISPHFHLLSSRIFSPLAPGRMFALFRHPVDRSLSMYHYLAKASWDPQYNPALARMSVEQYATSRYIENNWVTRFLVDKPGGKLTHADMLLAKKIIKFKCLVGLYEDMEVSMARFQRYFGWNAQDGTSEQQAEVVKCRSVAVARGDKHAMHPDGSSVREGSVAWNAIVRMNLFDMELYEYVKKIYKVQGEQIFDVVGYAANTVDRSPGNDVGVDLVNEEQLTGAGSGKSMAAELEEEVFEPRSGKSMAAEFEDEVLEPRSGKSMAADAFEDVFKPRSGKIMDTHAFEDEVFEPRSGHI